MGLILCIGIPLCGFARAMLGRYRLCCCSLANEALYTGHSVGGWVGVGVYEKEREREGKEEGRERERERSCKHAFMSNDVYKCTCRWMGM